MVKLLLAGHPKINLKYYIKELVKDGLCIDHTFHETNKNEWNEISVYCDFDPLTYLKICHCCDKNLSNNNIDVDGIYLHNYSPYTYEQYHEYEKFSNNTWKPDVIIYIYTSPQPNWNPIDYEINMKLDIMYNEPVCKYLTYKINVDDEPTTIYACICDIIYNI